MDPVTATLIFLLAAAAALIQSISGLGFGLLIVPPLVLVLGPKDAVIVSNVLATVLSLALLWRQHADVEWRMGLTLFFGSVVGMPLGLLVLVVASPVLLQLVIAIAVLVFTLLLMRGLRVDKGGLPGDLGVGLVSGVLRTSTSMSGPPVVIYLQGRGVASHRFRATLTAFFALSGSVSVILFAVSGQLTGKIGLELLPGIPALAAGLFGGGLIYRHINEQRFRVVVYSILIASALLAIVGVFFA